MMPPRSSAAYAASAQIRHDLIAQIRQGYQRLMEVEDTIMQVPSSLILQPSMSGHDHKQAVLVID